MVKVSARVVVSFSAPAEKLPLLDQFDAIIAREGTSDRSKTIMELIEAYVKRKAKTPNPQATLLVRPYPNIWSDEALDLADFPTDELREMDDLAAPKLQELQKELARRSGVKRREGPPPGY